MLTVGSLFSGIGGFDLGLERAGMRVVWQCESDEFCRRVLRKHWPDVECFPDVTELRHPPVVDVLCGGFPCQDISLAGRGAGIGGEQSGLWGEMFRVVRELRPRYRFWLVAYPGGARRREDAGGAHGDEAPDAGRRAQDDHEPVGAGAQRLQAGGRPTDAPDSDGGGWFPRVADLQARQPDAEGRRGDMADADSLRRLRRAGELGEGRRAEPAHGGPAVADPDQRRGSGRTQSEGSESWWAVEPDVGRVAHGIPARMDRLRSLGNALVPQIAEWIGRRILEHEEGRLAA